MALVAPFNLADAMITNVLSNVRRGVSLSRMQNTTDSTLGVMVDLPDKIDFEINLLKTHQFLARSVTTIDANSSSEGERVNASEISTNIGSDRTLSLSSDLSNATGTDDSRSASSEIEGTASSEKDGSLSSEVSGNRVVELDLSNRNSISKDGSINNELTSEVSGDRSGGVSSDRDGSSSREDVTEGGAGTSLEINQETTISTKNSTRSERTTEGVRTGQQETSTETRNGNSTSVELECSDRDMNSRTDRSYWKVDKETGSVVQAS